MNLKFQKNVNYTTSLCFPLESRVTVFSKAFLQLTHTEKLALKADPQRNAKERLSCMSDIQLTKTTANAGWRHAPRLQLTM